jgi:hypothetical protein
VAEPSAAVIVGGDGLHPMFCGEYEPVNVGPVLSFDHVIVLDAVDELPQASVAVHVLVLELIQPTVVAEFVDATGVTLPQLSVAVAMPKKLSCSEGFKLSQ